MTLLFFHAIIVVCWNNPSESYIVSIEATFDFPAKLPSISGFHCAKLVLYFGREVEWQALHSDMIFSELCALILKTPCFESCFRILRLGVCPDSSKIHECPENPKTWEYSQPKMQNIHDWCSSFLSICQKPSIRSIFDWIQYFLSGFIPSADQQWLHQMHISFQYAFNKLIAWLRFLLCFLLGAADLFLWALIISYYCFL